MAELKEAHGRETSRVMPVVDRRRADTVIVGAGIAGLAAGVVLASDGLDVVCIDPDPSPAWRVGESLDWSAHPLFERLGMSIESGGGVACRPKMSCRTHWRASRSAGAWRQHAGTTCGCVAIAASCPTGRAVPIGC